MKYLSSSSKSEILKPLRKNNTFILTFIFSFILICFNSTVVFSKNVSLEWDSNEDADYYVVYWGDSSGDYSYHSDNIDSSETQYTALNISDTGTWYFAVKAFNSYGNSSDFSDEVISNETINFSCSISNPTTDQSVMAGSVINFLGDVAGGNGNLSYNWDFGGSGTDSMSVEDPGNVTFSSAGTYTIQFTVTDSDSNVVTDTININVASDTIPAGSITSPASEQSVMAGSTINFQGSSSGGNGTLTYGWDFGGSGTGPMSVEDPGDVTFTNAGTYTITFSVTDTDGDVVTDTVKVNVASDTIPSGSISNPSSEQSIMAGSTINFQGNSSGGNGTLTYTWSFGGSGTGSKSVEDPGNVTFPNAGTYTITFNVTDEDGDIATDTVKINVASDTVPSATISSPLTEQSIMVGKSINFQGNASGGNGSLAYVWDFNGGAPVQMVEDPGNVIFSTAGTYTVFFKATDSDGDIATDSVKINVASDTIPAASIGNPSSEISIMAGKSVNFQGSSSGGNAPLNYHWDFDGGAASSSVEDPGNILFATAGLYEVAFTVTDSDGDTALNSAVPQISTPSPFSVTCQCIATLGLSAMLRAFTESVPPMSQQTSPSQHGCTGTTSGLPSAPTVAR